MTFKRLAPVLLALSAASAHAASSAVVKMPAGFPVSMPSVTITAMIPAPSLNILSMPLGAPTILPTIRQIPTILPARLPGVPSPLPMPVPLALSAVKHAAPSTGDHFTLDWSLLDGTSGGTSDDETSNELVPADPGPKPQPPAGAMNELRDATSQRTPIRVGADKAKALAGGKVFDGRREAQRELALPHAKFF